MEVCIHSKYIFPTLLHYYIFKNHICYYKFQTHWNRIEASNLIKSAAEPKSIKIIIFRIAQSVKFLPSKQENLSSLLSSHVKIQTWCVLVISAEERWRQEDFWDLYPATRGKLAKELSQNKSEQLLRPCLSSTPEATPEAPCPPLEHFPTLQPHTGTHVYTNRHPYTHTKSVF